MEGTISGVAAGVSLLVWALIYCYIAFSLQTIAQKVGVDNAWLAWIPIIQLCIVFMAGGKPWWWILFLPILPVFIIIAIIAWMGVAEARNKPSWLGILMIVPIANLILPGYLAFAD